MTPGGGWPPCSPSSVVCVATVAVGASGCGCPARPPTSTSPPARQPAVERLGDRRRVPVGRVASSASPGWCSPRRRHALVPGRLHRRLPRAARCWSRPRCAAPAPTRCRTSPRCGSSRAACAGCAARARRRHRLAVPAAAVPGRRARAAHRHRRSAAGSAALVVAAVVVANVGAGGMRSITLVQAFQYWLKLTAIAVPALFVLLAWQRRRLARRRPRPPHRSPGRRRTVADRRHGAGPRRRAGRRDGPRRRRRPPRRRAAAPRRRASTRIDAGTEAGLPGGFGRAARARRQGADR